jgi:Uma2 family endonuclease
MPQPVKTKAVYNDLYNLPENLTGEIINGEMVASPRPHSRHAKSTCALSGELYAFGRGGGPGGRIILIEPEVMLGEDLLVPDLAGWRQERLPAPPKENWVSVVPDWVCEVLSPNTFRIDRVRKMPIYAVNGVPYLWLIDPINKLLEAFIYEHVRKTDQVLCCHPQTSASRDDFWIWMGVRSIRFFSIGGVCCPS